MSYFLKKVGILSVLLLLNLAHLECCFPMKPSNDNAVIENIKNFILTQNYDVISISAQKQSGSIVFQPHNLDRLFIGIKSNLDERKLTFVIFSETFFSTEPLATEDITTILEKCKVLTKDNPYCFVFINFLHKFSSGNRPPWLPANGINERANRQLIISEKKIPEDAFWAKIPQEQRLSNYSLCIWQGEPLAFYRKSTYFAEKDDFCIGYDVYSKQFIPGDYKYEFGDWNIHPVFIKPSLHTRIYDNLFASKLIDIRICADINDGIEDNRIKPETKVCIIQANGSPGIASNMPTGDIHCRPTDFFKNSAEGCIFFIVDSHINNEEGISLVTRYSRDRIKFKIVKYTNKDLRLSKIEFPTDADKLLPKSVLNEEKKGCIII